MSLEEYRRKRDFEVTSEPSGDGSHPSQGELKFVIQKHAASRLHYDFRLELDGTLKSWAVPKGPSYDPAEKRLAVHVEDHPIDYGGFEGTIPKGQYGGGTVMLWDHGTWEPLDNARAGMHKGRLKFRLHGEKLQGGWNLVRIRDEDNWLLIKEADEHARPHAEFDVALQDRSVTTGRSLDEIAEGDSAVWHSNREPEAAVAAELPAASKAEPPSRQKRVAAGGAKKQGSASKQVGADAPAPDKPARKKSSAVVKAAAKSAPPPLPSHLGLELATLAERAPEDDEWLHEIKYDGYRLLARCEGEKVRLITRGDQDWTHKFSAVASALGAIPAGSVLDGEVTVVNPDGTSNFQALQNFLKGESDDSLVYYVFDLLFLEGDDLRGLPLLERKQKLAELLADLELPIRFSSHVEGRGPEVLESACHMGCEGIISKRADSSYSGRRTSAWLKIKCTRREEFVVVGWTPPEGSRQHFGSLLLAQHGPDGLRYAGRVGTGFNAKSLRHIREQLEDLQQDESSLSHSLSRAESKGATWVKPELVAEVSYAGRTDSGILRHSAFQGMRQDKAASQVKPERATPTVKLVKLSHPDRVIDSATGLTKLHLAAYYEGVAERLLAHLKGRPVTVVRCPGGNTSPCFYQKHVKDGLPDSVGWIPVQEEKDGPEERYIEIASPRALLELVQMGGFEFHPWGSAVPKLEQPDRLIFDLDPDEGLSWASVVEAALSVRNRLSDLGLESWCKTTGGKGLHVCVPLRPRLEWDEVKAFCKALAESMARDEPRRFTSVMSKAQRKGRIFLDYLRNGRGATAVAAYSARARAGCPVSTPLAWDEVTVRLNPLDFTIQTWPERAERDRHVWSDFYGASQGLTKKIMARVGMKQP